MTAPNRNTHVGRAVIEELIRCGAARFVVSPGSRSTPLALAVANHPGARAVVHFDERAAGFMALGWAKAAGQPVCLICTSGTAATNYYPAIVEAAQALVPLIVLTADRPSELLDTGANQAILQDSMFGRYTRWQAALAPDGVSLESILTTVDQAVYRATRAPAGPVHINCAFREPLAPEPAPFHMPDTPRVRQWQTSGTPYTQYAAAQPAPDAEALRALADTMRTAQRGVVLAGALTPDDAAAVATFSRTLGWPLFADTLSGLRLSRTAAPVVHHYDQLLLSERWRDGFRPDAVIQFGAPMTSKRLAQALEMAPPPFYALAAAHSLRHDPAHLLTHRIEMAPAAFCAAMPPQPGHSAAWRDAWLAGSAAVGDALDTLLGDAGAPLSEPALARLLPPLIPERGILFLGNSMPIRDADMFGGVSTRPLRVAANRGASGIDGNIATAAGLAMEGAPITAVIGDLALLHDLNALHLLHQVPGPAIVIVINNDGGGIFSFLPIARHTDHFESFWAAPHGLVFEPIATAFKLRYARPESARAFADAYRDAMDAGTPALIEISTARNGNRALHDDIQRQLCAALEDSAAPEW